MTYRMKRVWRWVTLLLLRRKHGPIAIRTPEERLKSHEAGVKAAETRKRRIRYESSLDLIDRYMSIRDYRVDKTLTTKRTPRTGIPARGQRKRYWNDYSHTGMHLARAQDFHMAEPLVLYDDLAVVSDPSRLIPIGGNSLHDLERPLRSTYIGSLSEDEDDDSTKYDRQEQVALNRVRLLTPKDARGIVRFTMPYMVEHLVGFADVMNQNVQTMRVVYGSMEGIDWIPIGLSQRKMETEDSVVKTQKRIDTAIGLQSSQEEAWIVQLQHEGCPSVVFTTDPAGAKEVFRLRDVPDGRKRRSSLINWVDAHYRQRNGGWDEALTYVRRHVRGATRFTWNGLVCYIKPARRDSTFSRRPDLISLRDVEPSPLALPHADIIDYTDEMEPDELHKLLKSGAKITPANRKGSWVSID